MRDCCSISSGAATPKRLTTRFPTARSLMTPVVVSGMLCVVTEETERVIGERRLKTLRDLGARTTAAKTVDEACRLVVTTLGENTADIPFSLLYLVAPDGKTARLCESSQLQRGTSASPEVIELTGPNLAIVVAAGGGGARDGPVHVVDIQNRFGELPGGPGSVPPKEAIVLPLRAASQERASAFLVAGISPYRAFDDSYRGFFELVAGQAAAAISNARAYEEERQACRGPGRAGPGQDRLLRQRQPRVSHAAHPDARPGRGRARRGNQPRTTRTARIAPSQCAPAAEARQYAA